MNSTSTTSNPRPKEAYDKIICTFAPHKDVAFNSSSIGRCTAIVLMQKIRSISVNCDCPPVMMFKLIRNQMFARQRAKITSVWKTPLGVQASILKRRITFCVTSIARKNVFRSFAMQKRATEHPLCSTTNGIPVLPAWISKKLSGKYKVNYNHLKDAAVRNKDGLDPKAEFTRRSDIAVRAYPTMPEVGQYVFDALYQSIPQSRTPSRKTVRNLFFSSFGYLFIAWRDHPDCPFHDSDVVMKWAAPMGEPRQIMLKEKNRAECETYSNLYDDTEDLNARNFHHVMRSMD